MKALHIIRQKLRAIKATPDEISKGYALGVFLGTTPFIGTKVFIALGLTYFLKWSKVASVVGVYHINIFTAPFFYGIAFVVGKQVTGTKLHLDVDGAMTFSGFFSDIMGNWEVLAAITTGGLILGIPLAAGAYLISRLVLK